jgi:hypothetical protein
VDFKTFGQFTLALGIAGLSVGGAVFVANPPREYRGASVLGSTIAVGENMERESRRNTFAAIAGAGVVVAALGLAMLGMSRGKKTVE